jgi:hypothetical protein
VGAIYCNVALAPCVNAALADNELIAAPDAGYTARLVALEFVIIMHIPATAVGSTTPCPAETEETMLNSFARTVAVA